MDPSAIDSDQSLPLPIDDVVDVIRTEGVVTTDPPDTIHVHLPPERWDDVEEVADACGWEVVGRAAAQHKLSLEPGQE